MANISEYDMYLFGTGVHYDIYKKMGAHPEGTGKKKGVRFAVWAPNAVRVWVMGTFNNWEEDTYEMERLEPNGIYELFVPGAKKGDLYRYVIETKAGKKLYKADPYANASELRPGNASCVADISKFKWSDKTWMDKRAATENIQEQPMNIYEVHPGSWKRHEGYQADNGFYTYRELAPELTKYMKDMGYTHVEFLGILEHPLDASWGYQVTGYYAPTSRYGAPEDFAYLVNYLHRHHIGVILDWVPAHFPRDAYGLSEFDGTCLYEYADSRKGEHPDWGTKVFDFGKTEVKNFLLGSALLWVEHYHVDGLRVDAVASMLYLDYGRKDGEWVANEYGGNENLEAIELFKHLNTLICGRNPGVCMIAEESTAWPKVTGKAMENGLNFTYKWNMGWMHDFLDYMKLDPYFRKDNHNKMTFAMTYQYSENYILVLSHDEVVHLKCSMLEKMPGLGIDKYRNLMAGYAFMTGHPGKKLLFMGGEFGQNREWSEERELDWFVLEDPAHEYLQAFVKELNRIYKKYPALWQLDNQPEGFLWINPNDSYRNIFSFVRRSKTGRNSLLFVINFSPMAWKDYRVGVPKKKKYTLLLSSDETRFGGTGKERPLTYMAEKSPCDNQDFSFAYSLPAYGVAVFQF